MNLPEDERSVPIVWPAQIRTIVARRTWTMTVICRLNLYPGHGGGTPYVPAWANHVLAVVAGVMPGAEGLAVVEEAARVLRDPDLCLTIRAAWSLGGLVAAAGIVSREAYPAAQGVAHG